MNAGRRKILGALAVGLSAFPLVGVAQRSSKDPFPGPAEPEPLPKASDRALLKLNQKGLKRDVQRLLELAQALEKEVEKTDATEVLSVSMIRKAEEIEKLAKHIKSLARG
jgi:hypothetical protein